MSTSISPTDAFSPLMVADDGLLEVGKIGRAHGVRGDLYVDKSGRLWFCKGGSTWKQLA